VSSALSVITAPAALQVSDRKRAVSPLLAKSATAASVIGDANNATVA
jgi:hypothetical protein